MNSATILVGDDESQIRRVMRTALAAHAYTIVEARNGEEALRQLRDQERLGLVILDLNEWRCVGAHRGHHSLPWKKAA
ncbi:MAG TPA: response regulator [Terriglobales bacterium]|jgi:CheY-like chemotaxis protein|nr:response regulator [Terriglobales bacterium]